MVRPPRTCHRPSIVRRSRSFCFTCVRYRAGAVISYLPLRHLPVVGLASKSYSFLGFRVAPGAESGFGAVYEDDGATTAYLDGHYSFTTLQYSRSSRASFNAVISPAANSTGSMVQRSYQVGGADCSAM